MRIHYKLLCWFVVSMGACVAATAPAAAQCAPLPYSFTNGQAADATQVMGNFNSLLSCLNSNGSVSAGTAGQLGYYASNGNVISGQSLSSVLDAAVGSSQGSVLYRGATGWTALGPGVSGQVLNSGGPGANVFWGSPAGLGPLPYSGTTGGAWTRPAGTGFSWVNQGAATFTDNTGGAPLVLTKPAGSSDNISLLCVSAPATPYSFTAFVTTPGGASPFYGMIGVALYDSGSGKVTTLSFSSSTTNVQHWNSTTSFSGNLKNLTLYNNLLWMRVTNDGTTLTYFISTDAIQWLQVASEATANFMPAITNVCWGANPNDNSSTGLPIYSELWQWTSP